MKKLAILLLCINFSSCIPTPFDIFDGGDDDYEYVANYTAVTLERSELNTSISFINDVEMTTSSKIYIIDDYIFINDDRKGFHIFDNTDSSNPIKKTFFNVPGATDIAIRDNVFYINQATDLVSLTIDVDAATFVINKRIENVFPELLSPDGDGHYENDEVVIYWIEK